LFFAHDDNVEKNKNKIFEIKASIFDHICRVVQKVYSKIATLDKIALVKNVYLILTSSISLAIYLSSVDVLIVLAFVSFLTGFKISFLPFKLCPAIFITSAVLIILGRLF
jgi:hypothetical protein